MIAGLGQSIADWLHEVFLSGWDAWAFFGLVGQLCFTMRFIVQWLASELAKKSVVPFAFWIFSLLGGGILLIYSIYLKNPVFILGNGIGFGVYLRNIWLIRAEHKAKIAWQKAEQDSAGRKTPKPS